MRQNTVCAAVALSVIAAFGGRAVDKVAVSNRFEPDMAYRNLTKHPACATALGDAMTRMQKENGDVPTHWKPSWEGGCS